MHTPYIQYSDIKEFKEATGLSETAIAKALRLRPAEAHKLAAATRDGDVIARRHSLHPRLTHMTMLAMTADDVWQGETNPTKAARRWFHTKGKFSKAPVHMLRDPYGIENTIGYLGVLLP